MDDKKKKTSSFFKKLIRKETNQKDPYERPEGDATAKAYDKAYKDMLEKKKREEEYYKKINKKN